VSNKVDTPASSRDLRLLMQKEDATEPNFLALLQIFRLSVPRGRAPPHILRDFLEVPAWKLPDPA
jgi:hypothetical protein